MPSGEKYHGTEVWSVIAHYDENYYFRGAAYFETEKEAKEYIKIFNDRITDRRDNSRIILQKALRHLLRLVVT